MDIADIERHKYNLKLMITFLKKEGKWPLFRYLMFTRHNRTPEELFETINKTNPSNVIMQLHTVDIKDRMWSSVFSYVPFCEFSWSMDIHDVKYMRDLHKRWASFLLENIFDKKRI